MARLPLTGQDAGKWGDLLNEFLRVEHNEDGTLKAGGSLSNKYTKPPTGIPTADIADTAVTEAKLSSAVQAKLNQSSADLTPYFNKTSDTTDAITESATKKFLSSADKTKLDGIAAGAQVNVQADWNASTGDAQILNKPSIAMVATSGSYTDLTNKPTIPTVPVQSVNSKTGSIVITPDDLSDTTSTNKFVTVADKTKLSNLSGTNTGDQDLSGLVPKTTTVNGKALTGSISLAGSDLSLTKSDVGLGNVDNTSDISKPFSTTALNAHLLAAAKNPDLIVTGTITLDGNGLITSAQVVWPDNTPGTLTITSRHATNAVLAYNITYGSPVTKTFTQPTITRTSTGAATTVPQIVIT